MAEGEGEDLARSSLIQVLGKKKKGEKRGKELILYPFK